MTTQAPVQSTSLIEAFGTLDTDSPIHASRTNAFETFQANGFPTLRDEQWRYTSIKPIAKGGFTLASAKAGQVDSESLREHLLHDTPCHQLVFLNGMFDEALSDIGDLDQGVRLETLASVIANDFASLEKLLGSTTDIQREAFTALNSSFITDGVYLHVPRGVELDKPVHVVFITVPGDEPFMTHPRVLVVAEESSKATIVETYASIGEGVHFTNTVTEIIAADNVTIDHYKIERESDKAFHVSSLNVSQTRDTNVTSHNFTLGGKLVRNHLNGVLKDEGCNSTFNGLVMAHDKQHVDNYLRIDHLMPNCNSWEYYKTILDDHAKSIFTGRIYVAQDAQKTDAKQTSANLLLSDTAHVTTKPQLEIFADDVKCTHGATIGQLEDEQMFYLQARGIDAASARSLLIYAFANETISEVKVKEIRDKLEAVLLDRLPQGHQLQGGL